MKEVAMPHHTTAVDPRRVNDRMNHYLDRALGGIALFAVHEAGTLRGYWADMEVRLRVARRARSAGELIRDQIDLLPESFNRLLNDQRVRRELWRGMIKDCSARESAAA
jgi:hypothetical protein